MTLLQRIFNSFSWFKSKKTIDSAQKTKQDARRPVNIDWTDSLACNTELTAGVYHNSYPGLKLAGGLAFPPIVIPVWMMGLPIVIVDNDEDQSIIDNILIDRHSQLIQLHIECHRDGTIWVWPKWSAKKNNLVWEYMPDSTVSDIIIDMETRDIVKIITDEEIQITTGYNTTAYIRRRRHFTKSRIDVFYMSGKSAIPEGLKDKSVRNPLGNLPIPFPNNKDLNSARGHSDLERILPDLKDYHDIDLQRSYLLSKFSPKQVQTVKSPADWKTNNGLSSINDLDIATIDFILNMPDEKTEFVYPQSAYEAYSETLKQKFRKIVEASGVPEIAWGLKTTGNHASVAESMSSFIQFVHNKQQQKNEPYKKLFEASLSLMKAAKFGKNNNEIKISWNPMDSVSDEVKSIVFKNFAQGMAALTQSAAITKQQQFELWKKMYPDATEEDLSEYIVGISDTAGHNRANSASYAEFLDFEQSPLEKIDD